MAPAFALAASGQAVLLAEVDLLISRQLSEEAGSSSGWASLQQQLAAAPALVLPAFQPSSAAEEGRGGGSGDVGGHRTNSSEAGLGLPVSSQNSSSGGSSSREEQVAWSAVQGECQQAKHAGLPLHRPCGSAHTTSTKGTCFLPTQHARAMSVLSAGGKQVVVDLVGSGKLAPLAAKTHGRGRDPSRHSAWLTADGVYPVNYTHVRLLREGEGGIWWCAGMPVCV